LQAQKLLLKLDAEQTLIGQPWKATLVLKHKPNEDFLLPDSNFNFSPYTCLQVKTFVTRTIENESVDSVIYTLATFELDSIQTVSLPAWKIMGNDTSVIYSNKNFIKVNLLTTDNQENVLNADTQYSFIEHKVDFTSWIVYIILFSIFLFAIYKFFGKPITKLINSYLFRIQHDRFEMDFRKLQNQLSISLSPRDLEKILSRWKNYMETLVDKPIRTYTSKEIMQLIENESLGEALYAIDIALYGENLNKSILDELNVLNSIAELYFENKKAELKNE